MLWDVIIMKEKDICREIQTKSDFRRDYERRRISSLLTKVVHKIKVENTKKTSKQ